MLSRNSFGPVAPNLGSRISPLGATGDARLLLFSHREQGDRVDVRRFVTELAKAGDEPGTIRNTFTTISGTADTRLP